MILTLDVGNSQLYAGVFDGESIVTRFRKSSKSDFSADEFGIFLRSAIQENGLDPTQIKEVAIASVVPSIVHSLKGGITKYFGLAPFILSAGAKTKLKIKYKNPLEVGADRIANAIAAVQAFPGRHLIVVDLGTATTFCAITSSKEYLGGVIMPGMKISMEALGTRTAKLPLVEILKPDAVVGRGTIESIQSGLFYGHLEAMKGIITHIRKEHFASSLTEPTLVVGTGGFSQLFRSEGVFDVIEPDLVLHGLRLALSFNSEKGDH